MSQTQKQFYRSSIHSSLYFTKKTMKELLSERNKALLKLNIKPQKPINQQKIIEGMVLLFRQNPVNLQEHQILVIRSGNTHYVFFSSDDSHVPICKKCFSSVYVSLRGNKGRVVCCNTNCKSCLLQQFQINQEYQILKEQTQFHDNNKVESQKNSIKEEMNDTDLQKIKKAAKKILEE